MESPYRIAAPPPARPPSKLWATVTVAFMCVAVLLAPMPACKQLPVIAPLIEPAGACIATQLLDGGATDPLQIVAACAGTTIEDVIAVIEALLAQQPDSGTSPTATQARLAAVHVRALGLRPAPVTNSPAK